MPNVGKSTATPRQRFPEFRKAEGWKAIPIGDKVDLLSGYPFDGADISEDSSGCKLLRGINITEGTIRHNPEIDRYFLGDTSDLKKFELIENDLVIGMDGSKVGKNSALISSHDAGSLLIQRVARLRSTDPNVIRFIFLHINSLQFHHYVDKINTSSGIPHISAKQIREFTICFPSEREQQKIADCLTSLDALIAAQGRKVEALTAHKRGLMQQLFPREGETLPRRRFPEFRDAPEWRRQRFFDLLDEVLDFRGRTPKKLGMEWGAGDVISLSANNVKNGYIDYGAECNLGSDALYSRWMGDSKLEKGDIVFTMEAPLGNALLVPDSRKYILSQRVVAFKSKRGIVNGFLIQLIWSDGFQNAINLLATGSTAKGISQKALQDVIVALPDEREQHRIADCLLPVDAQIAAESEKQGALKTHKKGLMQQLFPSPEEAG